MYKNINKIVVINSQKILLIMEIVAFAFLFLGTFHKQAVIVSGNDLMGIMCYLNSSYWIGLSFVITALIILWIYQINDLKLLYIMAIFLLGIYLLSIPVFLQKNASFFVSYYPAGEVQTILKNHYIDLNRDGQLISYHYWPGMHLFSATLLLILGIDLAPLLKYIPMFWVLILIMASYCLAKTFGLTLNQWLLFSWLLITAQWVGQYYYSAQALGMLMYIYIVSIMIKEKISLECIILFIIMFCSLIITHSLTSLAVLVAICVITLVRFKSRYIAILTVVLFFAFYMYLSNKVFVYGINEFIGRILNMEIYEFWKSSEFNGGITSLYKAVIHYARALYALTFILFCIASLWAIFMNRKIWPAEKRLLVYNAFLWMVGIGILLLFHYGTEMQYRVYLYSTVLITCLLILSYPRSRLILLLTILMTALHIPAHYGTYSYEQTLETELAGAKFLACQVKPETSYSYRFYPYVRYYDPSNLYVRCRVFVPQYEIYSRQKDDLKSVPYIADSLQSRNYMLYAFEYDPLKSWIGDNKETLEMVYDNGSFWTYNNKYGVSKIKKQS